MTSGILSAQNGEKTTKYLIVLRQELGGPELAVVHAPDGVQKRARLALGIPSDHAILRIHAETEPVRRVDVCELAVQAPKQLRGVRASAKEHIALLKHKFRHFWSF